MAQKIVNMYKTTVSSSDLNQRFGDFFGGSIWKGFRLAVGSSAGKLSFVKGTDDTNVIITWGGARIEETENLIDVVTIEENFLPNVRIDSIYVVYTHGLPPTPAEYIVIQGDQVGNPAPEPDRATHTLLARVRVPASSGTIDETHFEERPKGFELPGLSQNVKFERDLDVAGNLHVFGNAQIDGRLTSNAQVLVPNQLATKKYVDSIQGLSAYASDNDGNFVYRVVKLMRDDGTLALRSDLSDPDTNGNYMTVKISYYDSSGTVVESTEEWRLTYDAIGKIIFKVKQ